MKPSLVSQNNRDNDAGSIAIAERDNEVRSDVRTPKMYSVILLNDDYTPMEFVILVLQRFFQKDAEAATRIMLDVHTKGSGVCGTFTKEIAETKVFLVNRFAQQNQHPLKSTMEEG